MKEERCVYSGLVSTCSPIFADCIGQKHEVFCRSQVDRGPWGREGRVSTELSEEEKWKPQGPGCREAREARGFYVGLP